MSLNALQGERSMRSVDRAMSHAECRTCKGRGAVLREDDVRRVEPRGDGSGPPWPEFVSIEVTNIGSVPGTV
jgi:hypothetical protein